MSWFFLSSFQLWCEIQTDCRIKRFNYSLDCDNSKSFGDDQVKSYQQEKTGCRCKERKLFSISPSETQARCDCIYSRSLSRAKEVTWKQITFWIFGSDLMPPISQSRLLKTFVERKSFLLRASCYYLHFIGQSWSARGHQAVVRQPNSQKSNHWFSTHYSLRCQ